MRLRTKLLTVIGLACTVVIGGAHYGQSHLMAVNEQLLAALQAGSSGADGQALLAKVQEESRRAARAAWGSAVVAIGLGAALVLFVLGSVFDRLAGLRSVMARVADGDLDQRVTLGGNDEIDALSQDFNGMVDSLQRSERQLEALAKRYLAITDAAADAIITTDQLGIIQSWNRAASQLFGYSADAALGQNIDIILPTAQRESHRRQMRRYAAGVSDNGVIGGGPRELTARCADGSELPIDVSITEAEIEGERVFVGILRDISERKAAADKVDYLTRYDALTRLPNRVLLRERLEQAMYKAIDHDRLAAVLQLDLDRFMSVNDSLGHQLGDELLIAASERIAGCVPDNGHLARMGGDEFCIVMEDIEHVLEASVLAERLNAALDQPFDIQGHGVYVTASIGIAIFPFDDESPETLLKNADAAMHRCKKEGGNQYAFYAGAMNARSLERVALTADLRSAVNEDQFVLYYQPQVCLTTGRVKGAEALIRWQHPELGLVPPGQFIGLLEETGMILPVGEWAIREACKQNAQWHKAGFEKFRVAINLSVRQFRDKKLVDVLSGVLEETRMDPELFKAQLPARPEMDVSDCLELELTEGLLMDNTRTSCEVLDSFKRMGIKLSVDDFGTGYSSLNYLRQFPLDNLKIDQSFVQDVGKGRDSELIIQAIIDLAHNLQLSVIGEGVETPEQLTFLQHKGCDEIQGYLIARPMPAEEMQAWLKAWKPSNLAVMARHAS